MMFGKEKINGKQSLKIMLASLGALLFLTPAAKAEQIGANNASVYGETPIIIAAAPNDCLNDIAEGFSVETRNYFVGICYTRNGAYYVGRSKNGNGRILLRLSSSRNKVYVARSGRYTYTLDMNAYQLRIGLPNGRRITERVIKVYDS